MRKTLLAALIGASVFAVLPALAQVGLGGAGKVGAGVTAGANRPLAVPGQVDPHADQAVRRADRDAHHAGGRTRSALDRHGGTDVDVRTKSSVDAGTGDRHARANAGVGVDAGTDVDHAAGTARGVGGRIGARAHAAVDAAGHAAGATGAAVRRAAAGASVGADAKVRAKAAEHGH